MEMRVPRLVVLDSSFQEHFVVACWCVPCLVSPSRALPHLSHVFGMHPCHFLACSDQVKAPTKVRPMVQRFEDRAASLFGFPAHPLQARPSLGNAVSPPFEDRMGSVPIG
jgi:hypothetical protein